jgi:hypothetical protein
MYDLSYMLCDGKMLWSLAESNTNARAIEQIRKKYKELRCRGLFSFLYKPCHIEYAQFGMYLSGSRTDIYGKPDELPPRVKVDEHRYHYYECSLTTLPSMPAQTFF